jgi:hypothetical protein
MGFIGRGDKCYYNNYNDSMRDSLPRISNSGSMEIGLFLNSQAPTSTAAGTLVDELIE